MGGLALLVAFGLGGWWVLGALAARERVLAAARRACDDVGVQLLDETVSVVRLGAGRDRDGRLRLRRVYRFEVSARGNDRRAGVAACLGERLEYVRVDLPEGPVLLPEVTARIERLH